MSRALRYFVLLSLGLLAGTNLRADVRLPALFSQHMVLQRQTQAPVWGWACAGGGGYGVAGGTNANRPRRCSGQMDGQVLQPPGRRTAPNDGAG